MNWRTILLPSIYLALFALSAFAIVWWERRKRGTGIPFASDFRLLRIAGDHELKRESDLDHSFVMLWLIAAVAPGVFGLLLLAAVSGLSGLWMWIALGVVIAAFIAGIALALPRFLKGVRERADAGLAYYGERVVSEYLEPLKLQGWRVFYDLPCESGKEKFNIDHVVIGEGGVFAIETRTRRRNGARPGRDDYKVFYDGEQLSWPWGEDQDGTDVALKNAQWLQQWLEKTTGQKVGVVPVLALPGWYVEAKAKAAVHVVSPSWLPDMLAGGSDLQLNEKQVELCTRQLDQRCRDVAF